MRACDLFCQCGTLLCVQCVPPGHATTRNHAHTPPLYKQCTVLGKLRTSVQLTVNESEYGSFQTSKGKITAASAKGPMKCSAIICTVHYATLCTLCITSVTSQLAGGICGDPPSQPYALLQLLQAGLLSQEGSVAAASEKLCQMLLQVSHPLSCRGD